MASPSLRPNFKRSDTGTGSAEEKVPKVWPGHFQAHELSPSLQQLHSREPKEQVAYWSGLAQKLTPTDHMAEIPEPITSDFLGRYFDSNHDGSGFAYEDNARRFAQQGRVELQGFIYALGTHYGLVSLQLGVIAGEAKDVEDLKSKMQELVTGHHVQELWDLVKTEGPDGEFITKASFDYTLRRLRLGWMLTHILSYEFDDSFGQAYYYDYSESQISGSMPVQDVQAVFGHSAWKPKQQAVLQKSQAPIGDPESGYETFAEFLFSDPRRPERGGTSMVHWLHLHGPSAPLLLMLGQMYSIGIRCMSLLCRLGVAQSMYQHSREWNTVTFPAVYLESHAVDSLIAYKKWSQEKKQGKHSHDQPPEIFVSTITRTVAFTWGVEHENPDDEIKPKTAISMSGKASFLGKWRTGHGRDQKGSSRLCGFFDCEAGDDDIQEEDQEILSGPARTYTRETAEISNDFSTAGTWNVANLGKSFIGAARGSTVSEDTPLLSQKKLCGCLKRDKEEPDDFNGYGSTKTESMAGHGADLGFAHMQSLQDAEYSTSFDITNAELLRHLAKPYSVIRMGSHSQLVYRLLHDLSSRYMECVRLYSAAIASLQAQLKIPRNPGKDMLISKITHAKLQLETLLRLIEPFIQDSLPRLVKDGLALDGLAVDKAEKGTKSEVEKPTSLSTRVCHTHLTDIEHNLKSFVSVAESQIQQCELSIKEYDREAADHNNSILNFLTIITFLVMPVQILTGWYGMNFTHMPELKWLYGYQYAMALSASLSGIALLVLLLLRTMMMT